MRARRAAAKNQKPWHRRCCVGLPGAAAALLMPGAAFAQGPLTGVSGLSYLIASGPKQYPVLSLLLALIALMLAVVAVIGLMVLVGVFWRRAKAKSPAAVPPTRPDRGLSFIYVGIAVTIPLLFGISAWTYAVLARVSGPPQEPAFTIQVTG
ncbi:MAG TPA: hypothetical protein VF502_15370, partial [Stellaceae bacterium]